MKLLKVREVAEMLGMRDKTIYQWAELGQMPSVKMNGSVRFDPKELDAWVERCKKAADA